MLSQTNLVKTICVFDLGGVGVVFGVGVGGDGVGGRSGLLEIP